MERLYKMKSPNPGERVYVIGPMYLGDGMTTAVVVTMCNNAGKIDIVSFKGDKKCSEK